MHLRTPQSAILSAVIFNALIIITLIPLALRGVTYRAMGAAALLQRNLWIYGVGGIIVPFVGIKIVDVIITTLHLVPEYRTMRKNLIISVLYTIVTAILLGVCYPLLMTGLAQALFRDKANGQLIIKNGQVIGSEYSARRLPAPAIFMAGLQRRARMDMMLPLPRAQITVRPTRSMSIKWPAM